MKIVDVTRGTTTAHVKIDVGGRHELCALARPGLSVTSASLLEPVRSFREFALAGLDELKAWSRKC